MPGAGAVLSGVPIDQVQNPRKAGSLERDQPIPPQSNPLEPRPEVET
jgi:hypothetical protein